MTVVPTKYVSLGDLSVQLLADRVLNISATLTKESITRHFTTRGSLVDNKRELGKIIEALAGVPPSFRLVGEFRYFENVDKHIYEEHKKRGFRFQYLSPPITWSPQGLWLMQHGGAGLIVKANGFEFQFEIHQKLLDGIPPSDCYVEFNWSEDEARVLSKSFKPQWKGILLSSLVDPQKVFVPQLQMHDAPDAPRRPMALEDLHPVPGGPPRQADVRKSFYQTAKNSPTVPDPPFQQTMVVASGDEDDEPVKLDAVPVPDLNPMQAIVREKRKRYVGKTSAAACCESYNDFDKKPIAPASSSGSASKKDSDFLQSAKKRG